MYIKISRLQLNMKSLELNKICLDRDPTMVLSHIYRGWGHGSRVRAGGYGPSLIDFKVRTEYVYGCTEYGVPRYSSVASKS